MAKHNVDASGRVDIHFERVRGNGRLAQVCCDDDAINPPVCQAVESSCKGTVKKDLWVERNKLNFYEPVDKQKALLSN